MCMKKIFALSVLFVSACSMPPKKVCTDLSHVENGRFIFLDEDKEFERQQGLCRDVYKTPMDRDEFHKRFVIGRAKDLEAVCTCENGYFDKVKIKTDKRPTNESLPLSQLCREVQQDQIYLKGVSLAENDLKSFKPNHWSGPNELTREDGEKACKAVKSN